ncbi:MAG: DUF790 family protein [Myxococcales bacterium]|nr:DUF790 family protein [Myxococcales bacterium]
MLTSDLVRGTRRGDRLHVSAPSGKKRQRALEIAEASCALVQALVGEQRDEVDAALRSVPIAAKDQWLARGLHKLLLDKCTFAVTEGPDPRALRKAIFELASRKRGLLGENERLDTDAIRQEIATQFELPIDRLDTLLYADLRGTHLLTEASLETAEALVGRYGLALEQAVLLRAERVAVLLHTSDAESLRRLLRACKFRRLLWRLSKQETGWRLELDGPVSLLRSSTRYGLQLAMLLPVLRDCDSFQLRARVRWGKARTPLEYVLDGGRKRGTKPAPPLPPPDDVARLLLDIDRLKTAWTATAAADIVDLPGVGWCVPDVRLHHPEHGDVWLEVLGYWSRDAVWKRVELVQAGLDRAMVFALSSRLRVSEDVLQGDLPGALYVYKGVMHAKRVLERAEYAAAARQLTP